MAKILVIDDELNITELVKLYLNRESFSVETAHNGKDGLATLAAVRPDLVILDIKLKNECGLDLLQKIVKERHDMPVILSTAFSCYKDDFSAWLADGYVVKSSDPQELKDEINRVLAKKRKR